MQDQDPHHLHSSGWEIYAYLVLGVIIVTVITYLTVKLMKRLDDRRNWRYEASRSKKD